MGRMRTIRLKTFIKTITIWKVFSDIFTGNFANTYAGKKIYSNADKTLRCLRFSAVELPVGDSHYAAVICS